MIDHEIKNIEIGIDAAADASLTVAALHYSQYGSGRPLIKKELDKQIKTIQEGDLSQIEAILYSHAVTLNEVFNQHIRLLSVTDKIEQMQALTHIAFKAQNQCRNTLATLADIKRPNRTIFVRQQNNAFNQQVNCSKNELSKKIQGNELLSEGRQHATLDTRRTFTPSTPNTALETVANGGREDSRGQKNQ